MMQNFRGMAKWVIGFLLVAFVGWMVFDVGMDVLGRGATGATGEIARINDTRIDQQTFYTALRNAQEAQRRRAGSAPTTLEEQKQLEAQVLEEMYQQILINGELRRRDIRVTDEEIIAAARTSPPPEVMDVPDFKTDGQFDLAKYQRYLATSPEFQLQLESRYREEIPRLKLFEQLAAGVYVPTAKLWRMYRDQHDSVSIRLLALRPETLIPDSVARPADEQLRAHYSRHREDFRRPGLAYLSYASLPRIPNAGDSLAARQRADSLRRVIASGADFAETARLESADSVSAASGGDLGEVTVGRMVPEFERAALALRPGQVSTPVRTSFGWHIIKLESRNDKAKTYRARHILVPVELAGAHRDQVESRADSLDRFAAEQTDPSALDSVARGLGLPVLKAPVVTEGSRVEIGRNLVPDAGIWAFGAVRPGETSTVIETDHAYYIFRLDSIQPAGVPPFDAVKEEVRRALIREQKWDAARVLSRELAGEVERGAKIAAIAARVRQPVQTLAPFTRVNPPVPLVSAMPVVGAAFGLAVGQTGGPIETRDGIFFLEPVSRRTADTTAFVKQLETQRAQVIQAARQDRVRQVVMALREQAKVTDRRKEIEEQVRKMEEAAPLTP